MAYIRDRREELTGYQERAPYNANIDLQCDFVMVYGTDDTMPDRVKRKKSAAGWTSCGSAGTSLSSLTRIFGTLL